MSYQAHRSPTNPRLFSLHEQYAEKAAVEAHRTTPHCRRPVLEEAVSLRDSHKHAFYETTDG